MRIAPSHIILAPTLQLCGTLMSCLLVLSVITNLSYTFHLNGASPFPLDLNMRLEDPIWGSIPLHTMYQISRYTNAMLSAGSRGPGCDMYKLVFEDEPLKSKPTDVAVVTSVNRFELIMKYWKSIWNRALYCKVLNYECLIIFANKDDLAGRGSHFGKLLALHRTLLSYKFALWMDVDAFFSESALFYEWSIDRFIPAEMGDPDGSIDMVFGLWEVDHLNSGLMLVRDSPRTRKILRTWWKSARAQPNARYDQPALWHAVFSEMESLSKQGLVPNFRFDPYNGEVLKFCPALEYGDCRRILFRRFWDTFFLPNGSVTTPPGKHGFIWMHPGIREIKAAPKAKESSMLIFHCVFCTKAHRSFVVHTGSTSWGKESNIFAFIRVHEYTPDDQAHFPRSKWKPEHRERRILT